MKSLSLLKNDYFLLNFLLFLHFCAFSQSSEISFHSTGGVKFIVICNDKLINKTPDTIVSAQDLTGKEQRIRIEMHNKRQDGFNQNVIIKPGYFYDYEISTIPGRDNRIKPFSRKKYSLRLVSAEQKNENTNNVNSEKAEPILITMTYALDQYVTHYILPGYHGDIGCPWPLTLKEFDAKLKKLSDISLVDERLKVAEGLFGKSCIFSDEVRKICLLLGEENQRLDFAKFAFDIVFDKENLSELKEIFQNPAIRNDFLNFIKNKPLK